MVPTSLTGEVDVEVHAIVTQYVASCTWAGSLEDEVTLLSSAQLSKRERTACRLRLAEKRILQGALDIVRR